MRDAIKMVMKIDRITIKETYCEEPRLQAPRGMVEDKSGHNARPTEPILCRCKDISMQIEKQIKLNIAMEAPK